MPDESTEVEVEGYVGPERRRPTYTQLEQMRQSVIELGVEIRELTGQLEKVNQLELDQRQSESWQRQFTLRAWVVLAILVPVLGGIIGVGVWVGIVASDTSSQFHDFRDKVQASCEIRNSQVQANVDFFDGLLSILGTTRSSPQLTALTDLVNHQLKEQPKEVDCKSQS